MGKIVKVTNYFKNLDEKRKEFFAKMDMKNKALVAGLIGLPLSVILIIFSIAGLTGDERAKVTNIQDRLDDDIAIEIRQEYDDFVSWKINNDYEDYKNDKISYDEFSSICKYYKSNETYEKWLLDNESDNSAVQEAIEEYKQDKEDVRGIQGTYSSLFALGISGLVGSGSCIAIGYPYKEENENEI